MTPLDNTLDNLLERAFDAEQSGNLILAAELRAQYHKISLYNIQTDSAPAAPPVAVEPPPHFTPFGALLDGTPIMGEHDYTFPGQRTGCVWADVGRFSIVASADGLDTQSGAIELEGATPDDLAALRSLLLSDTCDRLFAAARAWEDGAMAPPTFAAPTPAIYTECLYHEGDADGDLTEEPCGPLAYVDYCIGQGDAKVAISFNVGGPHAPDVDLADHPSIKLDHMLAMLPNLLTLLSSEQVREARIRYEAGAPMLDKAA